MYYVCHHILAIYQGKFCSGKFGFKHENLDWGQAAEAPVRSEFLSLLRISEFFGFQWQKLAEILSLFKLYNNLGKVAVRVKLWLIIYCGHLVEWIVKQKNQVSTSQNLFLLDKVLPESGSGAFFVVNLLMLQLRVFLGRKCRIYALFFVANIAITRFLGWNFWQKFVRNSQKYSEFWQKF